MCLHTWSYGLEANHEHYLTRCKELNWHMIFPSYRGPNWLPEACGSDLVVSDLECAVSYMQENYAVDNDRIFLIGGSGGGHASLLMAGRRPDLFSAISSWCPISDLVAWYEQNLTNPIEKYDKDIASACGGDPLSDPEAMKQAKHRSPLTWLSNAKDKVILDISAGIHDGHAGNSVLVSHSIYAFNTVAEPKDRISEEDIAYIVEREEIPEHLRFEGVDLEYGTYKVLFRRVSGKVRLTLFEGGHNFLAGPGFGFLNRQVRGAEPVWDSGDCFDSGATSLTK